MGKTNNIGTYTLDQTGGPSNNGVYTIELADGVTRIAFLLATGGACTIQGSANIKSFGGASTSIALEENVPFIVSTNNENEYIDILTITVTAGTVKVISNQ